MSIDELIKFLESIEQEIDEYVEYLVDVEGIELSETQQHKISEPVSFQILRFKTDKTAQSINPPKSEREKK